VEPSHEPQIQHRRRVASCEAAGSASARHADRGTVDTRISMSGIVAGGAARSWRIRQARIEEDPAPEFDARLRGWRVRRRGGGKGRRGRRRWIRDGDGPSTGAGRFGGQGESAQGQRARDGRGRLPASSPCHGLQLTPGPCRTRDVRAPRWWSVRATQAGRLRQRCGEGARRQRRYPIILHIAHERDWLTGAYMEGHDDKR